MKSLVALLLLGQLLGCLAHPPLALQVDCDSPKAEHAAAIAVDYINNHNRHGYQVVLNRIEDVVILNRRPFGEIIILELDLLETTCHVLDPTPAVNCTVRSRAEHAVEGDCDVKLISVHGDIKPVSVKCHSTPDSVEDLLKLSPDSPVLVLLNDPDVVNSAHYALKKYNLDHPEEHYDVLEISRGKRTHLPNAVHVEFAIVKTNCSDQQAREDHSHCHAEKGENAHVGFCKASVIGKFPGIEKLTDEEYNVNCVIYDHKIGKAHTHLIEHHLAKNVPSPGHNFTVLDLIHSHNDTNVSHESHSAEALMKMSAPEVTKRSVPALGTVAKACPGKIRHFHI